MIEQLQKQLENLKIICLQLLRQLQNVSKSRKVYQVAKDSLGQNLCLQTKEYGCAEVVNKIIKKAIGYEIGGDISTYRMYKEFQINNLVKEINNPHPGDIILSPTGYGNGRLKHGHVGIISENNKVMSNNSQTLKWEENYTIETWKERYSKLGGFPVRYYRVL